MRTAIETDGAPAATGPYSQAIQVGRLLFVSGQVPLDPVTGDLVASDVTTQTHRVMRNLAAILDASGASFDDVVRTTVFLSDLGDYSAMNEAYATYFRPPAPARSTIEVARLPKDAQVEIDVIASLPA